MVKELEDLYSVSSCHRHVLPYIFHHLFVCFLFSTLWQELNTPRRRKLVKESVEVEPVKETWLDEYSNRGNKEKNGMMSI